MENVTYGVIGTYFVWSIVVQVWQALQIRKCMDLLAARSYGEYANGQAKMKKKQTDETIDPGF